MYYVGVHLLYLYLRKCRYDDNNLGTIIIKNQDRLSISSSLSSCAIRTVLSPSLINSKNKGFSAKK